MHLITRELAQQLPPLNTTNGYTERTLFHKFFTPWSFWAWYLAEYDEKSGKCFGWIQGLENEWGYFSLYYLESRRGPIGAKVERDLHFQPTTFSQMLHLKA